MALLMDCQEQRTLRLLRQEKEEMSGIQLVYYSCYPDYYNIIQRSERSERS